MGKGSEKEEKEKTGKLVEKEAVGRGSVGAVVYKAYIAGCVVVGRLFSLGDVVVSLLLCVRFVWVSSIDIKHSAGGIGVFLLALATLWAGQALQIASNFWLSIWSDQKLDAQVNALCV